MKILLLNQFCIPDIAPTGVAMYDLACHLSDRGHDVTIICSKKSYNGGIIGDRILLKPEQTKIKIIYLPALGFGRNSFTGKLFDYISFYFLLAFRLLFLFPKPDIVLSLTTPPYIGILAKCFGKLRGVKRASWIMDVYPDVMVAHGILKKGSLLYKLMTRLKVFELRGSSLIISLSQDMTERIKQYVKQLDTNIVKWVSLGVEHSIMIETLSFTSNADLIDQSKLNDIICPTDVYCYDAKSKNLRIERGWKDDELVVMYSGNMGLGHLLDEFLFAALKLKDNLKIRWVFAGGGKRRKEIEDFILKHPEANITLFDYVPSELLDTHLRSADIHLVSLDPKWKGCMLPSKLQRIFAVGRPALFVGDNKCCIAQWILKSEGGWIVEPGDVDGIIKCIMASSDLIERNKRAAVAVNFALENFDSKKNYNIICEWLEEIVVL